MDEEAETGNAERRDALARRLCEVMGWQYKTKPVWAGLRKVALAEAVVVGLDKLEEIINRLTNRKGNCNG